jgi:high affinity sulfate transporter 1
MKDARAKPCRPWPLLKGVLPLAPGEISGDLLAGATLAALGIPEVLGYAKIAGMPVVTGLYTIVLPMAVFALLGASRHLVVGADSATAAIFAAGATELAAAGSTKYVALAGLAAILAGVLLFVARLVRLGFLANFLSRTALVGFLTGVGVQVAAGQIGEMLGVAGGGHGTIGKLEDAVKGVPHTNPVTLVVSVAVIIVIVGMRFITRRIPGALIAVVGAIIVSRAIGLGAHGVAVLGPVPTGLPRFGLPDVGPDMAPTLLGTAISMFVVILAQSAATSRAYAARYNEVSDENRDLVGLALANIAAGLSGTFVVNGSPTKTEMVASAGGRSQLAQFTTTAVVLLVLLFLTGPLQFLPVAVLAAVVFVIGIELIDVRGMRAIYRVRKDEFIIALLTAAAVVFIGVEPGIILAIALSMIDHLRYSYSPRNVVLQPLGHEHWRSCAAQAGERTIDGLIVYRFGNSLYYANAHSLFTDVAAFLQDGRPLRWFCLDGAAMGDVDFTAAHALRRIHSQLKERDVRLVFSELSEYVRGEFDRYGITALVGEDAYLHSVAEVIEAFRGEGGA